jgi:hypothetical protein
LAHVPATSPSERSARYALVILTLINLFNYIDRSILGAVRSAIRAAARR